MSSAIETAPSGHALRWNSRSGFRGSRWRRNVSVGSDSTFPRASGYDRSWSISGRKWRESRHPRRNVRSQGQNRRPPGASETTRLAITRHCLAAIAGLSRSRCSRSTPSQERRHRRRKIRRLGQNRRPPRASETTRVARCGRLSVGKGCLAYCEAGRCGHVSGLLTRRTCAAGPNAFRGNGSRSKTRVRRRIG